MALFGITVLCAPISSAKEDHPKLHEASEALHAAQVSANPLQDLERARLSLNEGRPNKAGDRVEAMHKVDEAIAALNAGKRVEANKAITDALNLIEKGVALRPRDNKPKKK
jgi:hypothetical protein